jgi:centromeric protein E
MRITLEEERRALAAFVSKFDSLGLGLTLPPSSKLPMPGSAPVAKRGAFVVGNPKLSETLSSDTSSPMRLDINKFKTHPNLLEQMPEEGWSDISFDTELSEKAVGSGGKGPFMSRKETQSPVREILGDKENIRP